jgi:hypothetical protein
LDLKLPDKIDQFQKRKKKKERKKVKKKKEEFRGLEFKVLPLGLSCRQRQAGRHKNFASTPHFQTLPTPSPKTRGIKEKGLQFLVCSAGMGGHA